LKSNSHFKDIDSISERVVHWIGLRG